MNRENFVENVEYYCELKGVKPTIACKESGAGKDMINQIKRRGSVPAVDRVALLAIYLGVTTSDLLGETKPAAGTGDGLNQDERELIRISGNLPDDLRANLLCVARGLSALSRQDNGRSTATPVDAPASAPENKPAGGHHRL